MHMYTYKQAIYFTYFTTPMHLPTQLVLKNKDLYTHTQKEFSIKKEKKSYGLPIRGSRRYNI